MCNVITSWEAGGFTPVWGDEDWMCNVGFPWAWWRSGPVMEHVPDSVWIGEELSGRERLFWTVAVINGPHAEHSPSLSLSNQSRPLPACLPHDVFLFDSLTNLLKVSASIFQLPYQWDAAVLINGHQFPCNRSVWRDTKLHPCTYCKIIYIRHPRLYN